jgi:hypothetical protein
MVHAEEQYGTETISIFMPGNRNKKADTQRRILMLFTSSVSNSVWATKFVFKTKPTQNREKAQPARHYYLFNQIASLNTVINKRTFSYSVFGKSLCT